MAPVNLKFEMCMRYLPYFLPSRIFIVSELQWVLFLLISTRFSFYCLPTSAILRNFLSAKRDRKGELSIYLLIFFKFSIMERLQETLGRWLISAQHCEKMVQLTSLFSWSLLFTLHLPSEFARCVARQTNHIIFRCINIILVPQMPPLFGGEGVARLQWWVRREGCAIPKMSHFDIGMGEYTWKVDPIKPLP